MSHESDEARDVIITEHPVTNQPLKPTTDARKELYDLIARFRRYAANSKDTPTQRVFELAVDVLAGLVRLFKLHEDQRTESKRNEPTEGPN